MSVGCKRVNQRNSENRVFKMFKNAFFSVFSKKVGDTIYLFMVSDSKKCKKRNPVGKFPVIKHQGWIPLGTTVNVSIRYRGFRNITASPYQEFQRFFWGAYWIWKFWKNSWLFLMKIFTPMNFFRIFRVNVCFRKFFENILKFLKNS